MSVTFAQRGKPPPNQAQIQNMLNENSQLLQTIQEYQNKGKNQECVQYQQILHRNLVYLASIADANQNIQALLPPPSGVLIPSVQHGVHNTNTSLSQAPASPLNEMSNSQVPTPNNFPPQSNVYRNQPQSINPQRPPGNSGPQQYRPNVSGYPQQGPHQSFGNNQYVGPGSNHVPAQPNYNTSSPQPPSTPQNNPYQPTSNNYPPSQGSAPYNQSAPNNYGPPSSAPTTNHVPPQPNYNPSLPQTPSTAQNSHYQPTPNNYPPSQGPAPYSQPAPNGYVPPSSVSPASNHVQPNYNSFWQQAPSTLQNNPYQSAPNNYPPSQNPAPYNQPAPNGYGQRF